MRITHCWLNPCERGGVADELSKDPGVRGLAVVTVGEDDYGGLVVGRADCVLRISECGLVFTAGSGLKTGSGWRQCRLNPSEGSCIANQLPKDPGICSLPVISVRKKDQSGLCVRLNPREILEAGAVAPMKPCEPSQHSPLVGLVHAPT